MEGGTARPGSGRPALLTRDPVPSAAVSAASELDLGWRQSRRRGGDITGYHAALARRAAAAAAAPTSTIGRRGPKMASLPPER